MSLAGLDSLAVIEGNLEIGVLLWSIFLADGKGNKVLKSLCVLGGLTTIGCITRERAHRVVPHGTKRWTVLDHKTDRQTITPIGNTHAFRIPPEQF